MAQKERIGIVGTGLIGTSIGLALKNANLGNVEIVGHDKESGNAAKAKKMGAIDKTEWNLISTVEQANLVVIATPIMAIRSIFENIAPYLAQGCVVTDTASTKAQVVAWAQEILPSHVSFIGGHPMAGKETPGPEAGEAALFKGSVYCLVPAVTAHKTAIDMLVGMVNVLGAKPFFVDAAEHDGFVAGISHLPFVLSAALVSATSKSPSWREMSKLAASGYRDVSRLASGNPTVHADICATNRDSIVRWIGIFIDQLREYRQLVTDGGEALVSELERAQEARDRWVLRGGEEDEGSKVGHVPSFGEQMGSLFMGSKLAETTRKMEERQKQNKKRR